MVAERHGSDASHRFRYGGAMAHVRVWKFLPPAGREAEFERDYSSRGAWARLFDRAPGFRGTTLFRPPALGGWWLTIDRWESAADFEAFQRDFGDEYHELDEQLEPVAGEEVFIGSFEDPD